MARTPESIRRDLNAALHRVVEAEQELLDVLDKFERADRQTPSRTAPDGRFPSLGGRVRS
jgi:hypothetical protein